MKQNIFEVKKEDIRVTSTNCVFMPIEVGLVLILDIFCTVLWCFYC